MDQEEASIAATLDVRHAEAKSAFHNRDANAYGALFASNLRYEQCNGRAIDRSQLMRDIEAQFRIMDRATSNFTRLDLAAEAGQITETLNQNAEFEISAFVFVRRVWRLKRRGRYTWAIEDGQWKIIHVQVLSEQLSGRWRLGR